MYKNGLIDLLRSSNLNLPYVEDSDRLDLFLKDKYDILLSELQEFIDNYPSKNMHNLIQSIKKSTNIIITSLNLLSTKNLEKEKKDEIYENVFNMFKDMETSIRIVSNYYQKFQLTVYYRARYEERMVLKEQKDLFHRPFEDKKLVNAQRYSMQGFPCLYLGATVYTCYAELGFTKQVENLYVSRVEIPKDYKLITIGLLPYEMKGRLLKDKDIDNTTLIEAYIKMLPLIMACSIKRETTGNSIEKIEYFIPQLLTEWFIKSKNNFDGIIYFSNSTFTHSKKNYRLYQNLVIPTRENKKRGYSEKLLKEIKITKPVRIENIELFSEYPYLEFKNYTNVPVSNGRICLNDNKNSEIHYSLSGFHLLECKLSNKVCDYIK